MGDKQSQIVMLGHTVDDEEFLDVKKRQVYSEPKNYFRLAIALGQFIRRIFIAAGRMQEERDRMMKMEFFKGIEDLPANSVYHRLNYDQNKVSGVRN